jgi:hypothetical protein
MNEHSNTNGRDAQPNDALETRAGIGQSILSAQGRS